MYLKWNFQHIERAKCLISQFAKRRRHDNHYRLQVGKTVWKCNINFTNWLCSDGRRGLYERPHGRECVRKRFLTGAIHSKAIDILLPRGLKIISYSS